MARNYSSISEVKTLAANVPLPPDAGSNQVILNEGTTGLPSVPFVLVLNPDTTNEEAVLATSLTGSTYTVTRNIEGGGLKAHTANQQVRHMIVGSDLQLVHNHLDNTTTAHGVTGEVVGTTKEQTLTLKRLTTPKINENVTLTATSTELNVLDGITASTAELNIMDGVTSTTAELNILDGVTSSAAELNILDGATLSTTELNYVDGVTSAIQTQLNTIVNTTIPNATPTGTVAMWITDTAPTGWILCQGQAVSRTTYSALWDVLRTGGSTSPYGNGDGSTTFNLPDLRSRVPIGAGTGIGGGVTGTGAPTGGETLSARSLGGFTGDERRPQHSHGVTDPQHTHGTGVAGQAFALSTFVAQSGSGGSYAAINERANNVGYQLTGVSVNNDGAGLSQNIQPSTVINFIIKS